MKRPSFRGKASERILRVLSETYETCSYGRSDIEKIVEKLPKQVIEYRNLENPLRGGFPERILAGKRRHQISLRQFAGNGKTCHGITE